MKQTLKTSLTIALFSIGLLSFSFASAEIAIEHVAEVEVVTMDKDGNKSIELKVANQVVPGDTVVYSIVATNTGTETADNIVVQDTISKHMTYILSSAKSNAIGKNTKVAYSVNNGESFDSLDSLTVSKDGVVQQATAEDCTNIRWTLQSPLAPQKSVKFWFKARLK